MNYIPKNFLQLLCDSLVLRVVVLLLVFLLNEQSGAGAAGASFKFVFVLGGILRDAGRILETPIGINQQHPRQSENERKRDIPKPDSSPAHCG